jgi:hypothetical protein
LYIDSNEINGADGQPYKEFHNCNFDNFIADKKTPKLAKDIYLDKDWNLSNDSEVLGLLDSLTAENKLSRPFYFKVVTKSYKKSDGYYSEGLGYTGKKYVENNTREFITHFDNKECFTDSDLTTWADIVMLEFSLIADNEFDESLIDNYTNQLNTNCKSCSETQKETLKKFNSILKEQWNELLKYIDSDK